MANGQGLKELNNDFKMFREETIKRAVSARAKNKVKQECIPVWQENIESYMEECYRRNKPMTVAGICLACDISDDTYYRGIKGELDYITEEYKIINGLDADEPLITFSDLFKKASLYIQNQLEENCYTNKGNPAGSIFGLKARYGWQDDVAQQTTNNTLVIADKDKALQLLNMVNPD